MSRTARVAVAAGNTLGEGLVWCPRKQCLYWTDIQAATLWCHWPDTGITRTWAMPERLACLALCEDSDWLLLGLAGGLAFLHLPDGAIMPIRTVEDDLPTRLNDGACDREGRFVFGTLHEPTDGGAQQPLASFYRLDADLTLHRLALDKVAISNSIAFSPDGRTMYFCDSSTRIIQRCAYDREGNAGPAEAWVDLRDITGEPDGSTVDSDGGLWNAQWAMGRVVRYAADGREDGIIEVAAPRPTRPVLGGPGLNTLFVTSAHDGMSAAERLAWPQSGHVFAAHSTHKGHADTPFAGHLPGTDAVC
ncbi:MAG TPA: SMP-30/gluconolactonase/LRE family protein [Oleiagrimonas sp.]|nr:SMP-30/gluconolactonase/LRE family protein [Oleiagrimonas sp.]